jgi:hypothetical protein
MTPEEFRTWYDRLKRIDPDLTHDKLGKSLEVSQSTVTRWMNDKPGRGRPDDEGKGRRIENGTMLKLALERLEQLMIEERKPRRRRLRIVPEQPE